MFLNDCLADEFTTLHASLIDDDLMVFAQLYLVILDCFVQRVVLVASLLDIVDDLEEVDGDGKYLPACLQHLLVLLHLRLVLLLQLLLILRLAVRTAQDGLQLGLAHTRRFLQRQRTLPNISRTLRLTSSSKSYKEEFNSQYFRYSRM